MGLREHTQEAVRETRRALTALDELTRLLETARGLSEPPSPASGGRWRNDGLEASTLKMRRSVVEVRCKASEVSASEQLAKLFGLERDLPGP